MKQLNDTDLLFLDLKSVANLSGYITHFNLQFFLQRHNNNIALEMPGVIILKEILPVVRARLL